jgi:hypothetical protein
MQQIFTPVSWERRATPVNSHDARSGSWNSRQANGLYTLQFILNIIQYLPKREFMYYVPIDHNPWPLLVLETFNQLRYFMR